MPIYEYACKHCGHTFDILQKMNAARLIDCPDCGRPELKKLLSAPNFRLKGTGWYETDFKKDNRRNVVDGPDKSGDKSKASDSGKDKGADANSAKPGGGKKSGGDKTGGDKTGGDKPAGGKSGSI